MFGDERIDDRWDAAQHEQIERELADWFESTDIVGVALAQVDDYMELRRIGLACDRQLGL